MPGSESLREADRLMTICNSCRYCEGLCAVFPVMEMRRSFAEGDLNLIANLCHSCGACYDDCQFAPPHDFAVNVPLALTKVRHESWKAYAWPEGFAGLFTCNGAAVTVAAAGLITLAVIATVLATSQGSLFATYEAPGAFYRIVPHNILAILFGAVFLYVLFALFMGLRAFWRDASRNKPLPLDARALLQAMRDAGSLRYLDGGGDGCVNADESPRDHRKLFHHLTFYGFLLCFAATCVATAYHFLLAREAPYACWEPPVVLGTLGGFGLTIGPIGLMVARRRRRPELTDPSRRGMDTAFSILLVLTSASGLALLALRETPAMALTLAIHLGCVCAFFLTMPYSRFVHGLYRFAALVRYAAERRSLPFSE